MPTYRPNIDFSPYQGGRRRRGTPRLFEPAGPADAAAGAPAPAESPAWTPRPFVRPPVAVGGYFRGPGELSYNYTTKDLMKQEPWQAEQEATRQTAYQGALDDPRAQARLFQDIYGERANAMAAPILRQFGDTLDLNQANVASRFGGNASTEEERVGYHTADVFSRNLSEILGGMAGEAVQAGQAQTSQLGQAAQAATENRQRLAQLILQGLGASIPKQKKKGLGSVLGGVAGGVAGSVLGGAGAAAGAKLGGSL